MFRGLGLVKRRRCHAYKPMSASATEDVHHELAGLGPFIDELKHGRPTVVLSFEECAPASHSADVNGKQRIEIEHVVRCHMPELFTTAIRQHPEPMPLS